MQGVHVGNMPGPRRKKCNIRCSSITINTFRKNNESSHHNRLTLFPFWSSQPSFAFPDSHPLLRDGAGSISISTSIELSACSTAIGVTFSELMGELGHIFILESSPPVMRTLFCSRKMSYQEWVMIRLADWLIPQ